jgi:DNA-binding MarR family transcriptional regulator
MQKETPSQGELDPFDRIDRVIHEPARMKIMTHLFVVESGDFVYLMRATGLTRGNLSSHMTRLEKAGYIEVDKQFIDRKPVTMLRLTAAGREAFLDYRRTISRILDDPRQDA